MTGLYPDRHGATDPRVSIEPGASRLPRLLREAGYRTVAFTDGVYLEPHFGFQDGFDLYDGTRAAGAPPVPPLPRGGAPNSARGEMLFDRAIAYLEARNESVPLFLFLHTYAIHDYMLVHPWARPALPEGAVGDARVYADCLLGNWPCNDAIWSELEALYRAEMPNLDHGVARLLDALGEAGLADTTYFVLLSDHGEGFDPGRGRIHHGGRLHADQLRVPLWISGPGIAPGASAEPISLVDVVPTLLDLLGVAVPVGLDGLSLAGLIRGESEQDARPRRALFAMDHYHYWEGGRRHNEVELQPQASMVAVIQGASWYIKSRDGEELYDRSSDPDQRVNIGRYTSETEALRALAATRGRVDAPRQPLRIPPGILDQLRDLGYVE